MVIFMGFQAWDTCPYRKRCLSAGSTGRPPATHAGATTSCSRAIPQVGLHVVVIADEISAQESTRGIKHHP
jgi:hypothetical protein